MAALVHESMLVDKNKAEDLQSVISALTSWMIWVFAFLIKKDKLIGFGMNKIVNHEMKNYIQIHKIPFEVFKRTF